MTWKMLWTLFQNRQSLSFFRRKDYYFLGDSFRAEPISSKVLNCFYGMGWLYRIIAVYLET